MQVFVARTAGPCRGIRRAVRLVEQYASEHGPGSVAVLGALVDWPVACRSLERFHVRRIQELGELAEGQALALPVGGVSPRVLDRVESAGIEVLPTVCEYRQKAQKLAYRMAREGYPVLVLGPAADSEVSILLDWVEKGWREALARLSLGADRVFAGRAVSSDPSSLDLVPEDIRHVALVSRCVEGEGDLRRAAGHVVGRFKESRIFNTICPSVLARTREARRLGGRCGLVVVVGRREDPLSRLLVAAATEGGARAEVVEGPADLGEVGWEGVESVAVVSTCEVPQDRFVAVVEAIRKLSNASQIQAEL